VFDHDVLIRLGGKVEKRKKKLSKAVYFMPSLGFSRAPCVALRL
jgi:hypothetical protein